MKGERTAVQKVYQIAETKNRKALLEFLTQHGQQLLPFVELIADTKMAVDEFIDVLGRAALEAVLQLSAAQVAGPPHQGKPGGEVRRHGSQPGTVCLSTQKVRVRKPRLRTKAGGAKAEVPVPSDEAMQAEGPLRHRLSEILLSGVSTRQYERVVPEMAASCGISKRVYEK